MIANFKREDSKKIIVIGADKAEAILIKNLVEESKKENTKLSITEYYDVEGNVNGFALTLDNLLQDEVTEDNKEQNEENSEDNTESQEVEQTSETGEGE